MKIKVVAGIMAVLMCLAVTGCKDKDDSSNASENTSAGVEAATSESSKANTSSPAEKTGEESVSDTNVYNENGDVDIDAMDNQTAKVQTDVSQEVTQEETTQSPDPEYTDEGIPIV